VVIARPKHSLNLNQIIDQTCQFMKNITAKQLHCTETRYDILPQIELMILLNDCHIFLEKKCEELIIHGNKPYLNEVSYSHYLTGTVSRCNMEKLDVGLLTSSY